MIEPGLLRVFRYFSGVAVVYFSILLSYSGLQQEIVRNVIAAIPRAGWQREFASAEEYYNEIAWANVEDGFKYNLENILKSSRGATEDYLKENLYRDGSVDLALLERAQIKPTFIEKEENEPVGDLRFDIAGSGKRSRSQVKTR